MAKIKFHARAVERQGKKIITVYDRSFTKKCGISKIIRETACGAIYLDNLFSIRLKGWLLQISVWETVLLPRMEINIPKNYLSLSSIELLCKWCGLVDSRIDYWANVLSSSPAVIPRLSFFPFKLKRLRLSWNFLSRDLKNLEKDFGFGNKGIDVSYRF